MCCWPAGCSADIRRLQAGNECCLSNYWSCRTRCWPVICWAMPNPPNPTSPRWWPISGNPPAEPVSRRLRWLWLLWCAVLATALLLGTALPLAMRLGGLLLVASLAWLGHRMLLQQKLPSADYVLIAAGTRRLGALFWLHLQHGRQSHLLVLDAAVMEPDRRAALKGSLRLQRYQRRGGVQNG